MNYTRRIAFLFVLLTLTAGSTLAKDFNVTDYGARGDGVYENAQSVPPYIKIHP